MGNLLFKYFPQFSCSVVSNSLRPHELQHARLLYPAPTPRAYSNSCPYSWWCHPPISPSVVPFSSRLQSFPASESCPMSWFCTSCDQSIGAPCYSSVLFGTQRAIHPWGVRAGWPKRREENRSPWLNFGSAFHFLFLLPLSLPYVNLACQEGCLFYPRFSLQPQTFLCSIFVGFSLLWLLATAILDSFFLF